MGPEIAVALLAIGIVIGVTITVFILGGWLARKEQQLADVTRVGATLLIEVDQTNRLLNQYAPDRNPSG